MLAAPVMAAETVVHEDESAESAKARVAAVAKVDGLEAVSLATLRTRAPVGLGGARVLPCTSAAARTSDVEQHLKLAEGAYLYMEAERAKTEASLAAAALGCLSEPLEPALASRVWYLRGLVSFAAGEDTAAEEAFYRARAFDPNLVWDENFAPDARPLFDRTAVRAKVAEPTWVEIVPLPAPGELRVDGHPVDAPEGRIALPPGPHLVQIGASQPLTLTLEMRDGVEGTLVVPALLPADTLAWADDALHQQALSLAFAATLQRDRTVFVTDEGGVWQVRAGRDDWVELRAPSKKPVRAEPETPAAPADRKRTAGRWLAVAGGTVMLAGGTYAGVNMARAWEAYDTGSNANEWDTYVAAEAEYTPARARMRVGDAVAAGGAAVLGVGLVLAW